jgi:hypothetical protein
MEQARPETLFALIVELRCQAVGCFVVVVADAATRTTASLESYAETISACTGNKSRFGRLTFRSS